MSKAHFGWSIGKESFSVFFTDRKILQSISSGKAPSWALEGWSQMEKLLEMGLATPMEDGPGIRLSAEEAVRLDPEIRDEWNLPPKWPGNFRLETKGVPNLRDFDASLRILDERGILLSEWNLEGPVLTIPQNEYYLTSPAQFAVLDSFEKWRASKEKSEADHLRFLHTLSEAAETGCPIDLRAAPDIEIKDAQECVIDVEERSDGSLLLTPILTGLVDGNSESGEEIRNQIRKRLNQLEAGGDEAIIRVGKKIALLNSEQTRLARSVAKRTIVPSRERDSFNANPERWLADHIFVHGEVEFLPRVAGIGEWSGGYLGAGGELGESIDWFDKKPEHEDSTEDEESDGDDVEPTPGEDAPSEEDEDEELPLEPEGPVVPLIEKNDDELTWGIPIDQVNGVSVPTPILNFDEYPRKPFPHQIEAVEWLAFHTSRAGKPAHWNSGDKAWGAGALFADDMGLGKTFSTLLFLGIWYDMWRSQLEEEPQACLVVAPLSLVENWKDEVEKSFSPKDNPFRRITLAIPAADLRSYYATPNGRDVVSASAEKSSVEKYGLRFGEKTEECLDYPGSIVVTTYQTLRDYRFSFAGCDWGAVVFDEAQNIKNPNALQTIAAKALKGFFRIALTGTPVENHLGDLWSLMDAIEPGALGSFADFRNRWIRPLRNDPGQMEAIGQALRTHLNQLILRRTKEESLEGLPKKSIEPIRVPMTSLQQELYDEVLELAKSNVRDGDAKRRMNHHLTCMWELRRITLHPGLIGGAPPKPAKDARTSRRYLAESGKLHWLLDKLDEIHEDGEKVLIFCVQKQLQSMLVGHLSKIYGLKIPLINGDTKAASKAKPNDTRLGLIKSFSASPGFGVCVLSPIAAGAGLNIVAANHVIHLERHWNPAKEDQATDRAYRIGQKKNVRVYLPILEHARKDLTTFDMGLNHLLVQKRSLAGSLGLIPTASISEEELFGAVFGNQSGSRSSPRSLSLSEACNLSWDHFEALVALLYEREADEVILTSLGRDGGADVIVLGHPTDGHFLVQCKQTTRDTLDSAHAVREVIGAKPDFEEKLKMNFGDGVVHTNASRFSSRTKRTARNGSVSLQGRSWIKRHLNDNPVSIGEIIDRNGRRRRP